MPSSTAFSSSAARSASSNRPHQLVATVQTPKPTSESKRSVRGICRNFIVGHPLLHGIDGYEIAGCSSGIDAAGDCATWGHIPAPLLSGCHRHSPTIQPYGEHAMPDADESAIPNAKSYVDSPSQRPIPSMNSSLTPLLSPQNSRIISSLYSCGSRPSGTGSVSIGSQAMVISLPG